MNSQKSRWAEMNRPPADSPLICWRGEYGIPIKSLIAEGVLTGGHGVYTGPVELQDGPLRVWPLRRFLEELTVGRVLG